MLIDSVFYCPYVSHSYQIACRDQRIPTVSPAVVSLITLVYPQEPEARHDNAWGCMFRGRALLPCHLWTWALHYRLWRASATCLHSPKVVRKVSNFSDDLLYLFWYQNRCLTHSKALDEVNILHSRFHVDALIEECDFDTLWAEYGVIAILVIHQLLIFYCA